MVNYFVWSVLLCKAGTWTLKKEEKRNLQAFEIWSWSISWKDRVTNEAVVERAGDRRKMLDIIKVGKEIG